MDIDELKRRAEANLILSNLAAQIAEEDNNKQTEHEKDSWDLFYELDKKQLY